MTANNVSQLSKTANSPELIDLLPAFPSAVSFSLRVRQLNLSRGLEKKIHQTEYALAGRPIPQRTQPVTVEDEKELATEVLLLRHRFTELLLDRQEFRQAALTVLQNIYLFRNRRIFFDNTTKTAEEERQEALLLFSTRHKSALPLGKTFQHLVISRVWNRILMQFPQAKPQDDQFKSLHEVVERLNTLRNIYMLLSAGLVRKLAAKTNVIYRESITYEDAVQIGEIGVARAAYRYHQSCGVRFSTFAANWIFKEIQRQALGGRLIRISTNTVEKYAKSLKSGDQEGLRKFSLLIAGATAASDDTQERVFHPPVPLVVSSPGKSLETDQRRSLLLHTIDRVLSSKCGDIIKRRYGLPPYEGNEQSILAISKIYGVTRSSIYQMEETGLRKLQKHLDRETL